MEYLTDREWKEFIGVVDSPRDRAMLTVAYWRGLRASELGLLILADLDMKAWRLRVRRLKGSLGGEYHLSPDEVKALKSWLKVRGFESGPLFPSREGQSGIKRGMVHVLVQKYGKLAGLPLEKCHPHILKHSIATRLLDKGVAITAVQDWLGHRNIQNTMVYAAVTNAQRTEAERLAYA